MRISVWSSDVCTSDLGVNPVAGQVPASTPYSSLFNTAGARFGVDPALLAAVAKQESGYDPRAVSSAGARSEERRVGKEGVSKCRSRGSPYHYKKNKHHT